MTEYNRCPHNIPKTINCYICGLETEIDRLREHIREVADLILPNESEYKCDYRREWALSKIHPEGVADDD